MRAIAARHPALAQLSASFPALLLALARPRAHLDVRPIIAGVVAGVPLAALAMASGVPMWLRRVAPEMLPIALPDLPDDPFVRHRIVNHLPRQARHAERWFEAVSRAAQVADAGFAVWYARELSNGSAKHDPKRDELMSLWAWFSQHPGTRGHALLDTPWTPEMGMRAAASSARCWYDAVDLEVHLGSGVVDDVWLEQTRFGAYEFAPLRTVAEVTEEARAMENCVRSYGEGLVHARARLWSMREDGARVATMKVSWAKNDPLPTVTEVKLARNRKAPAEIWWAARCWLQAQDVPSLAGKWKRWDTVGLDRYAWIDLWRPYWLAKRRLPAWLPLGASREALRWL